MTINFPNTPSLNDEYTYAGKTWRYNGTGWVLSTEVTLPEPLTANTVSANTVELGNTTDTTLSRASAGDVNIEGNIIYRAGGTDVPITDGGTGASTAADARTNLELGDSATLDVGTTAGTVAAGDDSRIVNAVPNTRLVSAGGGLSGGGDLSADRTLSVVYGTTANTATQGNDTRVVNAVQTSRQIIAGAGLTGGGDLTADRTLSVVYGTTANTAAEGDDTRIVNAVQTSRTLTAGAGLTGGGDLSANRTFAVNFGTTANTVAEGNHNHDADYADISHTHDADEIDDTATTNKFTTATEISKLAAIEENADVTDAGNVGSSIHGATAKTTPVDADTVPLIDSAASNVLKKVTWANIKATLKTYLDTLYASLGGATFTGAIQVTSIEVGHATDSTLARSGAGDLSVEGNILYRAGGTDVPITDGGTGASTAEDARTNLGLGNTAVLNIGTTTGTVAAGDDARLSDEREWIANNVLTTDVISTSEVHDYAPTGYLTASVWRLQANTSPTITGIAGGYDGRIIVLHNISTEKIFLMDDASANNSAAANRIKTVGHSWAELPVESSIVLWYDGTSNLWRTVGNTPISANNSKAIGFVDDIAYMTAVRTGEAIDEKTLGKQTIWIPAAAMVTPTSAGAEFGEQAMSTDGTPISYYAFDSSSQEFVYFCVRMPKGWDEGNLTYQILWTHPATATNFGVYWGIRAMAIANDDTLDIDWSVSTTTADRTDTGGTTYDLYVTDESGSLTVGGSPGTEEFVIFQLKRYPPGEQDTLAVDAWLLGVRLLYTIDAAKDD